MTTESTCDSCYRKLGPNPQPIYRDDLDETWMCCQDCIENERYYLLEG